MAWGWIGAVVTDVFGKYKTQKGYKKSAQESAEKIEELTPTVGALRVEVDGLRAQLDRAADPLIQTMPYNTPRTAYRKYLEGR
jgi:hypothetical protein